jgi:hypothetical protein
MKSESHVGTASPAEAYASDLDRLGNRLMLQSVAQDQRWLDLASRLSHLALERDARQSGDRAARLLRAWRNTRAVPDSITDGAGRLEEPLRSALLVAERIEVAGGLLLAQALLRSGLELLGSSCPRSAIIGSIQRGRVLRTLGAHERAEFHYAGASRAARRMQFAAAEARAMCGVAAVAQQRGDLRAAARAYRRASRAAAASAAVRSLAQLGMCSVALRAGDLKAALRHGIAALAARPDSAERRAEVLFNISQICVRRGSPVSGLHAGRALLRLRIQPRTRLLGLGIVAVAASRSGDRRTVDRMTTLLRREGDEGALPYATAAAGILVSRAHSELGNAGLAASISKRAQRVAVEHGFERLAADAAELISVNVGGQPLRAKEASVLRSVLVSA